MHRPELVPSQTSNAPLDRLLALGKILHCRGVHGNRLVEIRESFNRDDNENVEFMAFARTAEEAVARAIACYAFDDVFVDPDPTNETGSFMTQDTLNSGPPVSKFDAMVLNGYVKIWYDQQSNITAGYSPYGRLNGSDLKVTGHNGIDVMHKLGANYWKGFALNGSDFYKLVKKLPPINLEFSKRAPQDSENFRTRSFRQSLGYL